MRPDSDLFLLHKKMLSRLQSRQNVRGEAMQVVKGTNRRVVVVSSPDERIFEQVIFIVRDDYLRKGKNSAGALLEEARKTADDYLRQNGLSSRRRRRMPKPILAAVGVGAAGLTWLAVHFAGVLF